MPLVEVAEDSSLENRLDALIALNIRLMHHLTGKDPKKEIGSDAVFLRGFGLKNPRIAAILGSTSASVAELISRSQRVKKEAKGGEAKRTGKNKRAS